MKHLEEADVKVAKFLLTELDEDSNSREKSQQNNQREVSVLAPIHSLDCKSGQLVPVRTEAIAQKIELNKMIESIKRIDLPKFQPELHQVCQYGQDGQLLKLYAVS